MTITLIETHTCPGQYGIPVTSLVVDHATHGRLMLVEGYGGEDQMRGGTYRWHHGAAIKLQPVDTIATLRAIAWDDDTSLYAAVVAGLDNSRPILDWDGSVIDNLATSAMTREAL